MIESLDQIDGSDERLTPNGLRSYLITCDEIFITPTVGDIAALIGCAPHVIGDLAIQAYGVEMWPMCAPVEDRKIAVKF